MAKLTAAQIMEVKGKGFLRNRGTDNFSGRIVPPGSVFSAKDMKTAAEIAEKFGNGKICPTTRLTIELVGIPYENIQPAMEYAAERGLFFGGTGNKIRPIAVCKGTTCIYGNFDTQGLAIRLHNDFYEGWKTVQLPHKFKIAVGGCPNSCMKPSLNDFGIEGHREPEYYAEDCRGCKQCAVETACPLKAASLAEGKLKIDEKKCLSCGVCTGKCPFKAVRHHDRVLYQVYVGGTWGKHTRVGTPLSRLVTEEEISPLLEKTLLWFKENGRKKERLGAVIDRLGCDKMEAALFSEDLLQRKEEILAKEVQDA